MANTDGTTRLLKSAEEHAYRIAAILIIVGFVGATIALVVPSEATGALAAGLIVVGAAVAIAKIIVESES